MVKLSNNELISFIPEFFRMNLKNSKDKNELFRKLNYVFDFDFAAIFYLNPVSVQL